MVAVAAKGGVLQSARHEIRTRVPCAMALMLLSVCFVVAAQGAPPDPHPGRLARSSKWPRERSDRRDATLDPATRDAALLRLRDAQYLLQAAAADRAETARLAAEREAAPHVSLRSLPTETQTMSRKNRMTCRARGERADCGMGGLSLAQLNRDRRGR